MKMEDRIKKTIYKHFGKPKNIVKERVNIFKEYSSPAGYKSPDFKLGDWQMGRMSVFTEKVLLNGDGSRSGLMTSEIKAPASTFIVFFLMSIFRILLKCLSDITRVFKFGLIDLPS